MKCVLNNWCKSADYEFEAKRCWGKDYNKINNSIVRTIKLIHIDLLVSARRVSNIHPSIWHLKYF